MGKYICFEGSEGVGKTTQVTNLVKYLREQGYKVLETKEPGTVHSPLTLELRKLMLDDKYNQLGSAKLAEDLKIVLNNPDFQSHLTPTAKEYLTAKFNEVSELEKISSHSREYISQAIRNIHLQKVVAPCLAEYDYIVQDRGILSGLSYGVAGGVDLSFMISLNNQAVVESGLGEKYQDCYDQIILLQGNVSKGLSRALSAKQEFESGDVMEKRGVSFLEKVNSNFQTFQKEFAKVNAIVVDGKNIEEVFSEIKQSI